MDNSDESSPFGNGAGPAPGRKPSPSKGRTNRRAAVLEAAARRFSRQGYAAASMRDIASDADMQVGSIYYHFASKAELLLAVQEYGLARLRESVLAAMQGVSDPWQRLEKACAAHLSVLLEGGELFQALIRELPEEGDPLRPTMVSGRDAYEAIFADLVAALPLSAAADRGGVRLALLGALNWAHTWYRPGFKPPEEIARRTVRYFREGADVAAGPETGIGEAVLGRTAASGPAESAGSDALPSDGRGWQAKLLAGDRRTIARAISVVENETADMGPVLATIAPRLGRAHVVGFTGAPGVGKSTLVSAFVGHQRAQGRSVGVVAVDPSSPSSGGAILGDRIRMSEHGGDDGVYVRSIASRGSVGGLSAAAGRVVDVLDAAGKDVIVVETVGAGQSEVDIASLAHTNVVVGAPGLGDEIQAIKHGILEIADVLVVNKADLPGADRTAAQLRDVGRMTGKRDERAPVLLTAATTRDGIEALCTAVDEHGATVSPAMRRRAAAGRVRGSVVGALAQRVAARIRSAEDPVVTAAVEAVMAGDSDVERAADRLAAALGGGTGPSSDSA